MRAYILIGVLEIKPPTAFEVAPAALVVFLAGSIDMGAAARWQVVVVEQLTEFDAIALNPRRDGWDSSWSQSSADPRFREQVEWELDGLSRADVIAMWLEPSSRSPVSLLELGLHASGGKLIVGCPLGFWRRGNVEVVCERFEIPLCETFEAFVAAIKLRLEELHAARGRPRVV